MVFAMFASSCCPTVPWASPSSWARQYVVMSPNISFRVSKVHCPLLFTISLKPKRYELLSLSVIKYVWYVCPYFLVSSVYMVVSFAFATILPTCVWARISFLSTKLSTVEREGSLFGILLQREETSLITGLLTFSSTTCIFFTFLSNFLFICLFFWVNSIHFPSFLEAFHLV